ncbi:MAG: hypothetical protein Q9183_004037, partial [Haloplaca sp. 2 TL-2023]
MAEESKEVDPAANKVAIEEILDEATHESASAEDVDNEEAATEGETPAAGSSSKKKKSKRSKVKKALGVAGHDDAAATDPSSSTAPASKQLTSGMVDQLLEMNPSLKGELAGMNKEQAAEAVKKLDVSDMLTGM